MLLDVLFPNRCLNCDNIIPKDEIVCVKCLDKIHFTYWDFGENLLKRKAESLFPLEAAYALMYFDKKGLSRELIHQLKYRNQEKIGGILAKWVVESQICWSAFRFIRRNLKSGGTISYIFLRRFYPLNMGFRLTIIYSKETATAKPKPKKTNPTEKKPNMIFLSRKKLKINIFYWWMMCLPQGTR